MVQIRPDRLMQIGLSDHIRAAEHGKEFLIVHFIELLVHSPCLHSISVSDFPDIFFKAFGASLTSCHLHYRIAVYMTQTADNHICHDIFLVVYIF